MGESKEAETGSTGKHAADPSAKQNTLNDVLSTPLWTPCDSAVEMNSTAFKDADPETEALVSA